MTDAGITIRRTIARNRARLFVGRKKERRLLDQLLLRDGPLRVLFLHGAGGIGKSTLLGAIEGTQDADWAVARCDARLVTRDPEPKAAREVLEASLACLPQDRIGLLLIDSFELWTAFEDWFRDEWLPDLPDRVRVVIAGRKPPTLRWRMDPGWHGLMLHVELAPLDDADASDYLNRRGLDRASHGRAIGLARGHPLTLALIADAAAAVRATGNLLAPEQIAGVLLDVLNHVVPDDPSSQERQALYLSALARQISTSQLVHVLEVDGSRAAELVAWLDKLSFMEHGPEGWFPHDVVREELRNDLLRYSELRLHLLGRAVDYALRAVSDEIRFGRESVLADALFLYWNFLPALGDQHQMESYSDLARPEDLPRLLDAVERHEGREQREILAFWWERQPEALTVVRGQGGVPEGFYMMLALRDYPVEWLGRDRQAECFWAQRHYLSRPLDPGEGGLLVRMWMDLKEHMSPASVATVAVSWTLSLTRRLIMEPDFALAGVYEPDDASWAATNRLCGHREVEESRCRFGDVPFVLSLHDFTRESAVDWLREIYRGFLATTGLAPRAIAPGPLTPRQVRAALRDLHRPHRLAEHLLIGRVAEGGAPVLELQRWIANECAALAENQKTAELHRVLDRAYLRPVGDQRSAAEACHMTWDQYRRRLTEAIKLLTARLEGGR